VQAEHSNQDVRLAPAKGISMIQAMTVMRHYAISNTNWILLAAVCAGGIFLTSLRAQSVASVSKSPAVSNPTRYQPNRVPKREAAYYEAVWGVEGLSVRAAESGELIRFSYRVMDPEKSKPLNDKKLEPALIFPEGHVKLVIPSLEKVGQLRQSSTPEAGKSYWMAFSNPHRTVKRGDRVNVVIGQFHADGLIVE
jgi:hypothetical protein